MLRNPFFFAVLLLASLRCHAESIDKNKPPESKKEISSSVTRYLQLFKEHPETLGPLGKWKDGEIEITVNPKERIRKNYENQMRLRLISKGIHEQDAEKWSSVGVVAEDNYWMWVRGCGDLSFRGLWNLRSADVEKWVERLPHGCHPPSSIEQEGRRQYQL